MERSIKTEKWPSDDRLRSSTVFSFSFQLAKTRWNIALFLEIILCLHHLFSCSHCLFLADEALRCEMKHRWKGLFHKYGTITAHSNVYLWRSCRNNHRMDEITEGYPEERLIGISRSFDWYPNRLCC